MSPLDLRLICTAMGFTAIVMKGDPHAPDSARRAVGFANLIESFCTHTLPHPGAAANTDEPWQSDETIERLKADLRDRGDADLHKDRAALLRLYDRLRQRYAAYAGDDQIADRVLELLDAEIERDQMGSVIS